MIKTILPESGFNIARLRILARVCIGWVIFVTLIPSFLMRLFDYWIPYITATSWGIGILFFSGLTGYLCLGFLRERKISRLLFWGIVLVFISQIYRTAVSMGFFEGPVTVAWQPTFRTFDNLINGVGIALIGLAFLYVIIEILASRQQLLVEHASLSAEVERRKTVEARLREREVLLRGISTSALDGIIVMDNEGCVTYWNPAAEKMLGYRAEEIMGRSLHETLAPANHKDASTRGLAQWRHTGQGSIVGRTTALKARAKNGSEVDVELSMSSMETGGQWHAVGVLRDITERKRLEQEHRELEAQVQYAQKLEGLGVLAGGIAHDFNNILQIILGNINMLEKEIAPVSPSRGFINNLKKSVDRASGLTRQMLAYSGKRSFTLQVLHLGDIVRDAVPFVEASVSKEIVLKTKNAKELPLIEADATQIEQVVMNLVVNAAEALDEEHGGVVTISTMVLYCTADYLNRTHTLHQAPEGDYVCLEVADTGCGMSKETVDKLFDPFFTTKFTGRGLGMSAVLGIMHAHNGAIVVESVPGEGTTIRALFPVSVGVVQGVQEASPEATPAAATEEARNILIVDDEADVLDLAALMVEQLGYRAITAMDGFSALDLFKSRCADIDGVLLDLSMPRMDGMETLVKLRAIRPDVRVVIASGYAEQDVKRRLSGHDVHAFLEKPYTLHSLAKTLEKALARSDRPQNV